jgi:hypothetical protein
MDIRAMMKRMATLAIVLALCPAFSFAQGRRGGGGVRGGGAVRGAAPQMTEESAVVLISALLQLNDSQQQQFRTAFDAAVKTAVPIAAQLEGGKAALFAAAKSGKTDDEIKHLADQQSALTSQILMLQAQTFMKLWAILSEQQKTEVDDFIYNNIGQVLSTAMPPLQPIPSAPAVAPAGGPPPNN